MRERNGREIEAVCPCCGARLKIDAALGKVVSHETSTRRAKGPDLERVSEVLQKEAARREALFKQSAQEEKTKGRLLERKFEEALKKTKDEPVGPPLKDIDLD